LRPVKETVPPCGQLWRGQTSAKYAREGLVDLVKVLEFNPYHKGPGPGGGQFTDAPGGLSTGAYPTEDYTEWKGKYGQFYAGSREARELVESLRGVDKWSREHRKRDLAAQEKFDAVVREADDIAKKWEDKDPNFYERTDLKDAWARMEIARGELERIIAETNPNRLRMDPIQDKNQRMPVWLQVVGTVDKKTQQSITDAATWLNENIDWQVGQSDKASRYSTVKSISAMVMSNVKTSKGRAEYDNGVIKFPKSADMATIIHEAGHAWEDKDIRVSMVVHAFLTQRTQGDKKVKLNTLRSGYDKDEVTRPDKFYSPYVGKTYSTATEVLSMGVEAMYRNPIRFAKSDPEHFMLTYDLMRNGPEAAAKMLAVYL
jgi:hypothetical protein